MARNIHSFSLSMLLYTSLISSSFAHPLHRYAPHQKNHDTITTAFPPPNSTASSIDFAPCPAELELPESLQCATFSVPINWDEPYGEHFDLGLVKMPAPANSTTKIGSAFINPGGPGQSAAFVVATIAAGGVFDAGSELFNAFDIIGLDPRGVGMSGQVKCDMDIFAEHATLFPETQEDYDALVDKNKRLGKSCREKTGPLFDYLDTISAAKDHEAVRVALGNEPLNFIGQSYGTQLGAQYAALFPNNIRTLVLDAVLQHSQPEITNMLIETTSYNLALTHFFEWASTSEDSPLNGQDVQSLWVELIAGAYSEPLEAPSCNGTDCSTEVWAEDILVKGQTYLVFATPDTKLGTSWGILASALYNASEGDASAFSPSFIDPLAVSGIAISCQDWTSETSQTLASVQNKKRMGTLYAPFTHGVSQISAIQSQCVGWPTPVRNPPKKLDIDTETTILVVNSDADPSTGYPWALGMLDEIRNKVFITRHGDGHTSFSLGGNTTQAIGRYLLTGQAPETDLVLDS